MIPNPCIKQHPCPRRELGCQARCPEYLEFWAANRERDKQRRLDGEIKNYRDYTYNRVQADLRKTKGASKTR